MKTSPEKLEESKNPHDEVNGEWTADTVYHLLMSKERAKNKEEAK